MASVPSHGEYSDPDSDSWIKIRVAIEGKGNQRIKTIANKEHFKAILLYCSDGCRLKAFQTQHRGLDGKENEKEWEQWKQEEVKDGRLLRYVNAHSDITETEDLSKLTLDDYLKIRVDGDRETLHHLYRGFILKQSDELLPMFCWIADIENQESRKAVFSIRTEDAKGHYIGAAVVTRDPDLIATLTKMFEHYENLSTEKTPPQFKQH